MAAQLTKSMKICAMSLPDEPATRISDEDAYLIVVADWTGGATAGERASTLAVEGVKAFVLNTLKWFLHVSGQEETTLFRELRQGLEWIDRAIIREAMVNPALVGMGTTLTLAYSVETDLYIA